MSSRPRRVVPSASASGDAGSQPGVTRAGLEPLRVHDLRHTAVALWIAAGASPNEIAARAGHTSVVTVLDRYGHLLPGSEDRVDDALDALGRGVTGPPTASVVPLPGGAVEYIDPGL